MPNAAKRSGGGAPITRRATFATAIALVALGVLALAASLRAARAATPDTGFARP